METELFSGNHGYWDFRTVLTMVTGNFREQLKFMNAISTNQIAGLLKWGI